MCSGEKQWWFEGYPKDDTDDEEDGDGKESKKSSKGTIYDSDRKDSTSVKKSDYGYEKSDPPRSRRSSSRSRKGSNVSARSSKRHSTSGIDKGLKSPISRIESTKSLSLPHLGSPTIENTSPLSIRKPSYSEITIPNEENQLALSEKSMSQRESDQSPSSQHSSLASKAFSQYVSPELSRQGSAASKHSGTSSLGKGSVKSAQSQKQDSSKKQNSPTPSARSQTSIKSNKSTKSAKSTHDDEEASNKALSPERISQTGSPAHRAKEEPSSPKAASVSPKVASASPKPSLKSSNASPKSPESPPKSSKSSPDHSDYEILSDKESPRQSNTDSPVTKPKTP